MKIFYWSPFFTEIATISAVINSARSLVKYPKNNKYSVSIINAIGEWDEYQKKKIKILLTELNQFISFLDDNFDFTQEFSFNKISSNKVENFWNQSPNATFFTNPRALSYFNLNINC